jgi:hypothetical protein
MQKQLVNHTTLFSISVPTLHALAWLHALMGCVALPMFHSKKEPLEHTCLPGGSAGQAGLDMLADSTWPADLYLLAKSTQ